MSSENKNLKCRICGNSKDQVSYIAKEMMFGINEEFEYFQCSNCGCLQIKEIPKNIGKYYAGGYYSFNKREKSFLSRLKYKLLDRPALFSNEKSIFRNIFPEKIRKRKEIFFSGIADNVDYNDKILDVGCGSGNILYAMKNIGFKNLLGIDPFIDDDIIYNSGLKILKKDVFDMQPSDKYDFIMLNHSFEHMENQKEVLQKIREILKPGGTCLIRVPVVSSEAWEVYKENWWGIDAPRHLFLHSDKSFKILAEETGFDIVDMKSDSLPSQFIESEKYKSGITLRDKKVPDHLTKEKIVEFEEKTKKLNDNMRGDFRCYYIKIRGDKK